MPEVLQRALNPRVAPRRILRRHPNHQNAKMRLVASRAAIPDPIRPLPRHEFAMPTQNRVRCHECRNLRQYSAAKPPSEFRETPPLTVVEPQGLPCEPCLQDTILLTQEHDDVGLLAMQPATQGSNQQLERKHCRSLRHGPSIQLWDTTGVKARGIWFRGVEAYAATTSFSKLGRSRVLASGGASSSRLRARFCCSS